LLEEEGFWVEFEVVKNRDSLEIMDKIILWRV
jgi:hypothetical protein